MAEWFCKSTGSSGNAGTLASPWDYASAASGHSGSVQPGDVVWCLDLVPLTDVGITFSVSGAIGSGVDAIDGKIIFRAYNPTVVGVPTSQWLANGKGTKAGTGDPTQQSRAGITCTNTSGSGTATGLKVNGVNGSGSTTVSVAATGGSGQAVAVGHGLTIASGPAAGFYMINGATTIAVPGPTTVTITPGLRGATAGNEAITLALNPSNVDATAISGSYLWFWNFEIGQVLSLRSAPGYAGAGFSNFGQTSVGLKFIYDQVHDVAGSPFFLERTAGRSEAYGCMTWNTGGTGTGDGGGHDYYAHHNDVNNRLLLARGLMLNGFTPHLQLYDAHGDPVNGIDLDGMISLNSGGNSTDSNLGGPNAVSFILGGSTVGVFSSSTMRSCLALQPDGAGDVAWHLGSGSGLGAGIVLDGNYARVSGTGFGAFRRSASLNGGGTLQHTNNTYRVYRSDATHNGRVYNVPNATSTGITWGGNKLYRNYGAGGNSCGSELPSGPAFIATVGGVGGCRTLVQFLSDTGLTGDTIQIDPSGTMIFVVMADKYEAGRAWVAYDNFGGLTQIPVDLSSVLTVGDTYVVHDARSLLPGASPIIGPVVYSGGLVNFPNTQVADPTVSGGHAGVGLEVSPTATAPQTNVFRVMRTAVAVGGGGPGGQGPAQRGGAGHDHKRQYVADKAPRSSKVSRRGGGPLGKAIKSNLTREGRIKGRD